MTSGWNRTNHPNARLWRFPDPVPVVPYRDLSAAFGRAVENPDDEPLDSFVV
jgi:hypothetical protein